MIKVNYLYHAGDDLAVVNAARRSFNTKSDWERALSHWNDGPSGEYLEAQGFEFYDESTSGDVYIKLKEKDKRLLHFLARGMSADGFEDFVSDVKGDNNWINRDSKKELTEKLWEWRNTPTHDTPFNHCFISFEVKIPVFVARQLIKHEYLIVSENSRRYTSDNLEFFVPDEWRKQSDNKKHGSGGKADSQYHPTLYCKDIEDLAIDRFKKMIGPQGISVEQARMILPQTLMVEWTWSGTLGAFAKMCQLRLHKDAQKETQQVAQQVYDHLEQHFPVSAPALVKGV